MAGMKAKVFFLLAGSGICAAFGGLQSVGVLECMQPLLLLQFLHHIQILDRKPLQIAGLLLLTLLTQTLGYTIAYAGEFNDPSFTALGVLTSFLMSLLFWVILLFLYLTSLRYQRRFPKAISSHPFAFPCVWTLFWHMESSFAPIGTTANPAYTQHAIQPMVLTVALWGLDGIVFFMALTATLLHQRLLLREEAGPSSTWIVTAGSEGPDESHKVEIQSEESEESIMLGKLSSTREFVGKVKQHDRLVKMWSAILILSLLYSGGRKVIFSEGFFEKGITETLKPTVGVSCILKQPSGDEPLGSGEFLWNATAERAQAGDGLIVWSETATIVDGKEGEQELFSKGREILLSETERRKQSPKDSAGPYLGLSYGMLLENRELEQMASAQNVFTLMQPDGSIGFRYEKSNPVPFVETTTIPGPGDLKAVNTPFGRISAAICFDFQFPRLLEQASYLGADIVLQPSWTWGPMAKIQLKADAFRAVENGFTLVRCSSLGESAVVTPYYDVVDLRESVKTSLVTMQLPITPRVWTLYPYGGFLFGILVATVAAKYLLMAWLPLFWVMTASTIFPASVNLFFAGYSSSKDGILKRTYTKSKSLADSNAGRSFLPG